MQILRFGVGIVNRFTRNIFSVGLICALFALVVDQVTKTLVLANAELLSSGIPLMPGFNLVLGRNDGVSFGLLGGAPISWLVGLAIGICGFLIILLIRSNSLIEGCAYGAIIGGALGNVLDRLRNGAVTDFFDIYLGSLHWPTFNMADVFIVGGAGCLVVISLLDGKSEMN